MAKRQNNSGGAVGLLMLAVVVIGWIVTVTAIYVWPAALLLALLYFEIRSRTISQDFEPNEEEVHDLRIINRVREEIVEKFQKIEMEGAELSKNIDGSYHRGSRVGARLNKELEELLSDKSKIDSREAFIQNRVLTAFHKWVRAVSLRQALRFSLVAYLVIAGLLHRFNFAFVNSFSRWIEQNILTTRPGANDALYGSLVIATVASALFVWVLYRHEYQEISQRAVAEGRFRENFLSVGEDDNEISPSESDRLDEKGIVSDQGHADAQDDLPKAHHDNDGEVLISAESLEVFRKAAEQGDADMQNLLGSMFEKGIRVEKDDAQAIEWYRKAAEQGHAEAQLDLGLMYVRGCGVGQDMLQGIELCRKAAAQGSDRAQVFLGELIASGFGVGQNDAQKIEWLSKAAAGGVVEAQEALRKLGMPN